MRFFVGHHCQGQVIDWHHLQISWDCWKRLLQARCCFAMPNQQCKSTAYINILILLLVCNAVIWAQMKFKNYLLQQGCLLYVYYFITMCCAASQLMWISDSEECVKTNIILWSFSRNLCGVLAPEGWWEASQPSPKVNQEPLVVKYKIGKPQLILGWASLWNVKLFHLVLWHCQATGKVSGL